MSLPSPTGMNHRPACMQQLGLLPPYSVEDVKRAFRALAKTAHPDAGGAVAAFQQLHDAYERALSLAGFFESRRRWLGERTERYVDREQLVADVAAQGGRCVLQDAKIYLSEFGVDFAHLLCELVTVSLAGCQTADATLQLIRQNPAFQEIRLLDVSRSNITDAGLACLADASLFGLDLRGTAVSASGLAVTDSLPRLEWLHVGQTHVGMWKRMRMHLGAPDLEIVTDADARQPDYDAPAFRQAQLMRRVVAQTKGDDAGE